MRPFGRLLVVALALLGTAAMWWAVNEELVDEDSAVPIALALTVVAISVVAGWMSTSRAAWSPTAALLALTGMATVLGIMRHVDLGTTALVCCGAVWLASPVLPAWLVWGHPDGPGPGRTRWLVATTVVAIGLAVLAAVIGSDAGPGTATSVTHGRVVPSGARIALAVQSVVVLAFTVAALLALMRRRSTDRGRRASSVVPLTVAGAVWAVALAGERLVHLLPADVVRVADLTRPRRSPEMRPWAGLVGVMLPLAALGAFVATVGYLVVVRPRLDRLPDGSMRLDEHVAVELDAQLANWAGDPSLRLTFPDGRGGWIDASGRERHLPGAGDATDRAVTELHRDGRLVARLEHDPMLRAAPEVVAFAVALASSAIDADAASALAAARVADARRLGSRLVTADALTRGEVRRELEEGPLRDVAAAVELVRSGAPLEDAMALVRTATSDTRLISHGLYPPELIDGGLRSALDGRRGAPTRRLPSAVEVTAYLLARDDPAAYFVDRGTMLEVHLSDMPDLAPSLDAPVVDRIDVLGGEREGSVVSLPVGGA